MECIQISDRPFKLYWEGGFFKRNNNQITFYFGHKRKRYTALEAITPNHYDTDAVSLRKNVRYILSQ